MKTLAKLNYYGSKDLYMHLKNCETSAYICISKFLKDVVETSADVPTVLSRIKNVKLNGGLSYYLLNELIFNRMIKSKSDINLLKIYDNFSIYESTLQRELELLDQ